MYSVHMLHNIVQFCVCMLHVFQICMPTTELPTTVELSSESSLGYLHIMYMDMYMSM